MQKILFTIFLIGIPFKMSAQVVISEIMWMGTERSTADEWIELTSVNDQSLSNWTINYVKNEEEIEMVRFAEGTEIQAGEYFLISNYSADASAIHTTPDLVTSKVVLPNSKLILRLRNQNGELMDEVDDGTGAPFAGSNKETKASMQRVSIEKSGTDPDNWITSTVSLGWDDQNHFGTPGFPYDASLTNSSVSSQSSSAQSFSTTNSTTCIPSVYHGIVISEFLPDPEGDDAKGEWIELHNRSNQEAHLCGWSLDDAEGGSSPFLLDGMRISSNTFIVQKRSETGIALNNSNEEVRLINPNGDVFGTKYDKAPKGFSFARTSNGQYSWTPFLTPEKENVFQSTTNDESQIEIHISAVLPNPASHNTEWIELTNKSDYSILLDGWILRVGSQVFELDDVTLQKDELRRFSIQETEIILQNDEGTVELFNPSAERVSFISWDDAEYGKTVRPFHSMQERLDAKVLKVIDGDTIDIALTNSNQLDRVPESIKRRWLSVQSKKKPSLRVRLIGIDTPETVHPSKEQEELGAEASEFLNGLLKKKEVTLEFDQELWDKYSRLLAYVYFEDQLAQEMLLNEGLATAYLHFPFGRSEEFSFYQSQARKQRRGMWEEWEGYEEEYGESEESEEAKDFKEIKEDEETEEFNDSEETKEFDEVVYSSLESSASLASSDSSKPSSRSIEKTVKTTNQSPLSWVPKKYTNVVSSSSSSVENVTAFQFMNTNFIQEKTDIEMPQEGPEQGLGTTELIAVSVLIFGAKGAMRVLS